MNGRLLLDTHVVLWLDAASSRLKARTQSLIETCWRDDGTIWVSAVSVWEIALLVDTGRIALDLPVVAWIDRFLKRPGVLEAPLTNRLAARAYDFDQLDHRDPADRLLISTAIGLDCPLVTYDDQILAFAQRFGARYGFSAIN